MIYNKDWNNPNTWIIEKMDKLHWGRFPNPQSNMEKIAYEFMTTLREFLRDRLPHYIGTVRTWRRPAYLIYTNSKSGKTTISIEYIIGNDKINIFNSKRSIDISLADPNVFQTVLHTMMKWYNSQKEQLRASTNT